MGFTLKQFEQIKERLGGARRVAEPLLESSVQTNGAQHEVILGIDPSLRGTGYGILRVARPHPRALAFGVVHCPAGWERSRCLVRIAQTLREAIQQHRPSVCAIEGLFFAQNLQTALLLGEARGVSLLAAAEAGLQIFEMAPRKVKQATVGYGGAGKEAVAKMVQRMLRLPELPQADAADALALALAFGQERGRYSLTPLKRL